MKKIYLLVDRNLLVHPYTHAEAFPVRMQAMRAIQERYGVDPDSWHRQGGLGDGYPTAYDWVTVKRPLEDGTYVRNHIRLYTIDLHPRP